MDLNIGSMDGKVREVLQCLVHSIRLLTDENKATNACVEAMKINLAALQGNVVRGNITEPTPYIQTKNFRRAFSSLTRNKGESLLTLSVRVNELAKQAYPAVRKCMNVFPVFFGEGNFYIKDKKSIKIYKIKNLINPIKPPKKPSGLGLKKTGFLQS